ncbi:hypothetical protein [Pseudomonas sp. ADAK13]|uniref:hypothetical protein n=1 Tax=Pseudomonas sp. ADAK13 TaxID=2730847 RepID=UPI0014647AAF|nr:hypothetical protein [Pseudomonas sp. ADAK13]QJI37112.1 hypothetical protein HKK54_22750 [Pseudomonas sp. ADAK13]
MDTHFYRTKQGLLIGRASALLNVLCSCAEHFEHFPNDKDACTKLFQTLFELSESAMQTGMKETSEFCLLIIDTFEDTNIDICMKDSTIYALQQCFVLIDWQIELFDVLLGRLDLESAEQERMIKNLQASLNDHNDIFNKSKTHE